MGDEAGGGGALRQVFAAFGVTFDTSELAKGNQAVMAGVANLRSFGAALGGIGLVKMARDFVSEFAAQASEIRRESAQLGMNAQEFQSLGYAMSAAGVSSEQATLAMSTLERQLGGAGGAGGRASAALAQLHVRTRDAAHQMRPMGDIMDEAATAMGRVTDPTRRAAMAQAMFGRGGRALIPVLHDGAGGLRTLRQEFEDLGGGITQEALDASRQYGAENRRLNASFGQLRSTIAVALLPAFTWFVHVQVRLARGFNDLTKGTHVVQIALAILASVAALAALKVLVTWFPVIAPFLAWAAVIAGVILVIDDLITMVEGGDSEIGHLIDTIWGVGTTKEVVAGLKLWWEDFRDSARMLAHDFEDYWLRAINAVSRAFAAVIDPLAARFEGVRRLLGTDVAHNVAHQESLAEFRARMVRLRAQQPLAASGTTQAATAGMVGPENQQAVARTATVPAPVRVQVAVPAAARAPVQHTSHRTLNAPITIHGGTASPQEIATHVRRELAERETAAADANHPSPEGD